MKAVLWIAVPGGLLFTLLAWSLGRLSSDAIALILGCVITMIAVLGTMWTVSLGRNRDAQDDDDWQQPGIVPAQPQPIIITNIIIVQSPPAAPVRMIEAEPTGLRYLSVSPQQRRRLEVRP